MMMVVPNHVEPNRVGSSLYFKIASKCYQLRMSLKF